MLGSLLGISVSALASNRIEAAQLLGLAMKEAFEMAFKDLEE
jgi:hypothetical protein